MTDDIDIVYKNCKIVTQAGRFGPSMGIAVTDGKIVAVGRESVLPSANEEIDLGGNLLVPGVIDCHVHTRAPGHEYKEDWKTATQAAAAGGVTTAIAMPNTEPAIDRVQRVKNVFEMASQDAHIDYQTHVVVTSDNIAEIPELVDIGIAGFKIFLGITFGDIEAPTDGELYEAMERIGAADKRLGFHEENDEIREHLEMKFRAEERNDPIDHNLSRPPIAEKEAVSRVCLLGDDADCPVHMFHLSSGSAAETLAEWRAKGADATAETCPHYLWFTDDVVREQGTLARVQPPTRSADERQRLWQTGMNEGAVDCIATDHAPHTDEEKGVDNPEKNIWETPGGFVGIETQVPAMLTFVDQGRLSLTEWVRMHSTRPAQIWGMYPQKGSLLVGTDADFTVVDPDAEWTLDRTALHSKSTATIWDGETFTGKVTTTVVRGEVVYDGSSITANPGYGKCAETGPVR